MVKDGGSGSGAGEVRGTRGRKEVWAEAGGEVLERNVPGSTYAIGQKPRTPELSEREDEQDRSGRADWERREEYQG